MAKAKSFGHMHGLVLGVSVALFVATFSLFAYTMANASAGFNSGKQLNANNCDTSGSPIINVTEKVVKTVDSGEGGNNWAFDDVNRQIQVWKNSDNTYCALINNEGKFDSQAGQKSPGNTGVLTGAEDGAFSGGYRALITGTLLGNPGWRTKGSVGTHNYNCDIAGNCAGYVNWLDQYFAPGYTFSYQWWGWRYQYKSNTWVNSSDGNSGDII
jgi:hypothetical protein